MYQLTKLFTDLLPFQQPLSPSMDDGTD